MQQAAVVAAAAHRRRAAAGANPGPGGAWLPRSALSKAAVQRVQAASSWAAGNERPQLPSGTAAAAAGRPSGEVDASAGGPQGARRWQPPTDRSILTAPRRAPPAPATPADVSAKFAATAWGKKLAARSAKAAMTDFDR